MIAVGKYRARAKSHDFGSTENGKDFIAVDFEIAEDGPHKGHGITKRMWCTTDGAIQMAIKSLKAAGWDGVDIEKLNGLGSKECEIVVKHSEYDGKTYAEVEWVNEIGLRGVKPEQQMDTSKRSAFAAKMRGHVLAANAPDAAANAVPAPKASVRDDIPF